MASQGIGSLATLIKRLEAATSRLEDIATSQVSAPIADTIATTTNNNSASAVPPAPPAPAAPAPVELPASITAFDSLLSGPLQTFLSLSLSPSLSSPSLTSQSTAVQRAFTLQRAFLLAVVSSRDPGLSARDNALTPTATAIGEVLAVQEASKDRKEASMLKTVAEGVVALSWVQYEKPGTAVQGQRESSEFYANRVIKEFKESDPKRVEWARSFIALLNALEKYVKEYFPTGLVWNPKGSDFQTILSNQSSSPPDGPSAPSAPAPPPPPPPPPPTAPAPAPAAAPAAGGGSGGGGGDMSALFASLNQGSSVTSGLRKVDPSQMTHKNPGLRKEGGVPDKSAPGSPGSKGPPKPPKPAIFQKNSAATVTTTTTAATTAAAKAVTKPPRLELEGKKWVVENFENRSDIVIDATELSHQINIYGCKNSVIQVKGKVNAVTLVSCKKTSLLLDTLVSSLSITSSPSFTVQILGSTPTIMIDATDSGQIYLSKDCLGVEIVTAKASAINVSLPVEGEEEGIFEERAVPEQLKTTVEGGRLVTRVLEHSG